MNRESAGRATSKPAMRLSIQWAGPGVIMAVSGIGASDVIAATVGGAMYGTNLLWALVLGAIFKFVLTEGLARWQLATSEHFWRDGPDICRDGCA